MKSYADTKYAVRRIIAFILLCFAISGTAQPRYEWIRSYRDAMNDKFTDVFINREGNYAICGNKETVNGRVHCHDIWFMLLDSDGRVIHDCTYGGIDDIDYAESIIEVEGGGYLIGGLTTGGESNDFAIVRIDTQGDEIWFNTYGGQRHEWCYAIIELKDGNFLLAGGTNSFGAGRSDGYLVMIDGEGNVIWDQAYGREGDDYFYALREIPDGILLAGKRENDGWLLRTDFNGDVVWERSYIPEVGGINSFDLFNSLVSCRGAGYMACGMTANIGDWQSSYWACRVDMEGNRLWESIFDHGELGYPKSLNCVALMPDDGFIFVGQGRSPQNIHEPPASGFIIRTDSDGVELWSRIIPQDGQGEIDAIELNSVLVEEDGGLVAVGWGMPVGDDACGLIFTLTPDRTPPRIIRIHPEMLEFDVLQGDTVLFDVDVVDLQEDELFYSWIFDDEEISTDTMITVEFIDFDDHIVQCFVSDGDQADSCAWLVHTVDLIIRDFTPDSLNLSLRRGNSVNFSLNAETLEDLEMEYLWRLEHRNHEQGDIGDSDSVTVSFDLTGQYRVEGLVFNDNISQGVHWNVQVNSCVWWWWPHELEMTVPLDTLMDFVIFPFNPESDSMAYVWELDGEIVEDVEAEIELNLNAIGEHSLTAYVTEGQDADTVRWLVDVRRPDSTPENQHTLLPVETVLYPPAPNPFNSEVSLRFYLPETGFVELNIHDMNGRIVEKLVDNQTLSGFNSFSWNADRQAAGVYFLVLKTNGVQLTEKLLLIK